MNNVIPINNIQTMSSREISTLTGKEHKNVLRDVGVMLLELGIDGLKYERNYSDGQNRQRYEYCLDENLTLCLVSGYSITIRKLIIDRWKELENNTPQLPQTMAEALRLAADQAELLEEQALKIEQDAPKVKYVEAYMESEGLLSMTAAAKSLGFPPRTFTGKLRDDRYIYGTPPLPYQQYMNTDIFKMVEGVGGNGRNYSQIKVTAKGMMYFAKRYATELGA